MNKSSDIGRRLATRVRGGRLACSALALTAATSLLVAASPAAQTPATSGGTQNGAAGTSVATPTPTPAPTLEETRLAMEKWMSTQQIISKERKDWQQGKEILLGRLDVVKQEIAALEEKIKQAETGVAEANKKRDEQIAENEQLKTAGAQLTEAVTAMEAELRKIYPTTPDPIRTKLQPLHQRIPEDPATTKVSAAERFQNVLGILNELNKANNEISVSYEVHELAGGKPAEVKAIYVGLAQAYYVSAGGEAGIGRPGPNGWKWDPQNAIANEVLMALEIIEGKHSPAFVPFPVRLP